ncbi:MAG: oligoendopeptidase, partial [Bacillales bacterium]
MKYKDTWDLDSIFPGGTKSAELQNKIQTIEEEIRQFETSLNRWQFQKDPSAETLLSILKEQEKIGKGLGQSSAFVQMCHDSFMDDEHANVVMGQVMDLTAEMEKMNVLLAKKLVSISSREWLSLFADKDLEEVSFALNEIRTKGKRLLSEKEERIITELNKDGLTAWSRIYDTVVSIMTIPFTDKDGETTEYSVGQAMNRMYADPDPAVRKQLFENWEKAWSKYAPVFADVLNHLSGFRLTLQKLHHRKDFMEEPLEYNRMSRETLDAMWTAVAQNKQPFIHFLNAKAKIFGMEKLGWQDVEAPVALGDYE